MILFHVIIIAVFLTGLHTLIQASGCSHARKTHGCHSVSKNTTSFHVIDSYLLTRQQLIHSLGRSHPLRINMALEQNNYLASEPGNFVQQTAFVLRSNGMAQLSI
jgi:hypothetical protein